ncbi:hypothetical protein BpHYR1_019275 [Brachionus plicatilis]|uniref:Uncharacterized protein n=1 Tax=Brachionus plicatilis TaxID=10195 RepID=A0A3M7QQN3_BRAPC|nr:hypothetical protein BpHYR1_019275 [Brachionus plicatilis]
MYVSNTNKKMKMISNDNYSVKRFIFFIKPFLIVEFLENLWNKFENFTSSPQIRNQQSELEITETCLL